MRYCLTLWFWALFLAGAASAQIELTDTRGRNVQLQGPAMRIVSLAPHITEVVYAAGAGDRLVGVVSYSDFPPEARTLPLIGSYDSVNLESLLLLKPDLVLAWHSGNGEDIVKRMERLGLTVFVSEPRTLPDVAQTITDVGYLAGTQAQASRSSDGFLRELASLRRRYSQLPPISVYYQIWNEPLLTLNGRHLISDVMRLCGGTNAFADAPTLVARINVESVVAADPQVIIASGMDQERPQWLDDWRQWETLTAVKNDQLYFVPPDLLQRHTPRIIQGAKLLCGHLDEARTHYTNERQGTSPD